VSCIPEIEYRRLRTKQAAMRVAACLIQSRKPSSDEPEVVRAEVA
jgi:hypothetical protein